MKSPAELTELFRDTGRKVTPQRQGIFRALHGNPHHPTAEAVHARVVEEMPTVSLRTVYATLHELAALGEIGQLELGTGSARFDPNVAPHHHLVCDRCGRVHDVEAPIGTVELPAHLHHGFEVTGTEIVFRGRCAECRRAEGAQEPGFAPVAGTSGREPGQGPAPRRPLQPSRGDVHTHG